MGTMMMQIELGIIFAKFKLYLSIYFTSVCQVLLFINNWATALPPPLQEHRATGI